MRNILCLTAVALALSPAQALAQFGPPGLGGGYNPANRPVFSPYLNLLRRDTPLVNNYYGLVRPEINFRNAIQQLDQQQTAIGGQQTALTEALTPTGHASQFMSQRRYFMNNGGAGGLGQGFAGQGFAGQGAAGRGLGPIPGGAGAQQALQPYKR